MSALNPIHPTIHNSALFFNNNFLLDLAVASLFAAASGIVKVSFQVTKPLLDILAHLLAPLWSEQHHHKTTGQHTAGKGQKITNFHKNRI